MIAIGNYGLFRDFSGLSQVYRASPPAASRIDEIDRAEMKIRNHGAEPRTRSTGPIDHSARLVWLIDPSSLLRLSFRSRKPACRSRRYPRCT